jgi:hypothetical protein
MIRLPAGILLVQLTVNGLYICNTTTVFSLKPSEHLHVTHSARHLHLLHMSA